MARDDEDDGGAVEQTDHNAGGVYEAEAHVYPHLHLRRGTLLGQLLQ